MNINPDSQQILKDYAEHCDMANALGLRPKTLTAFRNERQLGMAFVDVDSPIHDVTPENKMFLDRLMELVGRVSLGMKCKVKIGRDHEVPNGRYYFQIACFRMDVITKIEDWGYGGKAYLSHHMTDSELFQIMFGLYKGYWEHEARENFEVDGVRPFGPHISTEALISVSRKVDVRSAQHVEDSK